LNGIKVTADVFNKYPKHFHSRIIRAALKIVKGDLRRIERVHIEAVVKAVDKKTGTSICEVPGDSAIYVSYGELYIYPSKPDSTVFNLEPEEKKSKDAIEFYLPGFGVKAVVNNDCPNCKLRFLKGEDTIENSSKKISRILTDKKIPPFYREMIPCIVNEKDKVVSTPINLSDRFTSKNITWIIAPQSPIKDIL
ncbi:MAG: tRNA lysidine(34) synthetase TilS, partial [Deltaproteobacteria bacterium]|nr:tRNA lysidine(34) synthetase TilS [Deltaproteobacteria bacterium]